MPTTSGMNITTGFGVSLSNSELFALSMPKTWISCDGMKSVSPQFGHKKGKDD